MALLTGPEEASRRESLCIIEARSGVVRQLCAFRAALDGYFSALTTCMRSARASLRHSSNQTAATHEQFDLRLRQYTREATRENRAKPTAKRTSVDKRSLRFVA